MIIDTSFRIDSDTKSGLVVRCMSVLGNRDPLDDSAWDENLAPKIKGCKKNILGCEKSQYFNLNGEYYSYGDSSAYRIIDNSSVETYANKTSKHKDTEGN